MHCPAAVLYPPERIFVKLSKTTGIFMLVVIGLAVFAPRDAFAQG
jgi:hypothetical protein